MADTDSVVAYVRVPRVVMEAIDRWCEEMNASVGAFLGAGSPQRMLDRSAGLRLLIERGLEGYKADAAEAEVARAEAERVERGGNGKRNGKARRAP